MSAASGTRIFGIKLGLDPKIVVGALFAVALLIFILHGRSDDDNAGGTTPNPAIAASSAPTAPAAVSSAARATRRRVRMTAAMDRGAIRIQTVDATRGDIDPTLRIDMLQRLQSVPEPSGGRSLFEIGEAAPSAAEIQKVNQVIKPGPVPPPQPVAPTPQAMPPAVNIPLKFYGFVKPARRATGNRGLFLDGDNVVAAQEGDVIDGRYLVITVTAENARIEDTQAKQGQTLQVEPQALQQ